MVANPLRLNELLRRQLWEASWGQLVCGKDEKGPRVLPNHQFNRSQLHDRRHTNGERSCLAERRGPPGGPGLARVGPFLDVTFEKVMSVRSPGQGKEIGIMRGLDILHHRDWSEKPQLQPHLEKPVTSWERAIGLIPRGPVGWSWD